MSIMSEMSPQFHFAQYFSFEISPTGALGAPFPPRADSLDLDALAEKYVYAFGESVGTSAPWELVAAYRIEPLEGPEVGPRVRPMLGSADAHEPLLGAPEPGVRFPVSVPGGRSDRKYFFLAVPRYLDGATIAELCLVRPEMLPVVAVKDGGRHVRYFNTEGDKQTFGDQKPDSARLLFVVDPYAVAQHLADTLEFRCDSPIRWTMAEAGYDEGERVTTEERLARLALAREIDALRKAGLDLNAKLAEDGAALDKLLRDYDPSNTNGELTKRLRARDAAANAVIALTSGPLFWVLERDARASDARAKVFYSQHLEVVARCLSRLGESKPGHDYLEKLSERFPTADKGTRPEPRDSNEAAARLFLFADANEARPNWANAASLSSISSLLSLHAEIAKVMAASVLSRLKDLSGLEPSAGLQEWANLPVRDALGLTAYRWAYHLRSAYSLERVELDGKVQTVIWSDGPLSKQFMSVLDLSVNWEQGEWEARFSGKLNLARVQQFLTATGLCFTFGALAEALDKKEKQGAAILSTTASTLSFISDPWVHSYLGRLGELAKSGKGVQVTRALGAVASVIGFMSAAGEAEVAWVEDGEGDVTLAMGASALGGAVGIWGATASWLGIAGPPGWVVLGGLSVAFIGPLVATLVKDTPVEKMTGHCAFGREPGAPHVAPKLAGCSGDNFAAWAQSGAECVRSQVRAFGNATWAFGVQGVRLVDGFPLVRLVPQRLVGATAFHVRARLYWGNLKDRRQLVHDGAAWLHVGEQRHSSLANDSGDTFAATMVRAEGMPLAVLSFGSNRAVDWLIAPGDLAVQQAARALELTEVQLDVRLSAFGPNDERLSIPAPVPPAKTLALRYTVVEPNGAFVASEGGQGQTSQDPWLFHDALKLSTEAYS